MSKGKYLNWLMEILDCDVDTYGYLMVWLFNKEYYWVVPMDENRSEDGKQLRELYSKKNNGASIDDLVGPCSVLEMMTALARRWRMDITSDDGTDDGFGVYFWEMIENLGLKDCTNNQFQPEKVEEKVTFMLDRGYSDDGKGGLFPIKTGCHNQKVVDLWYQLHAYLAEKEET